MSVRSCFTFDEQEMNQEIRRETALDTDGRETLVRRSSRLKVLNTKGRNREEDFAEKANALFRSRAGHISTLTRIQGDIKTVMCACEETSEVMLRKAKYDDAWRKFVNAHEQYIEYIISKEEKEKALLSYERQKIRKLYFDEEVQRWCKNLELEAESYAVKANSGKKQSGIARTGNLSEMSSRSGRSTAISKRAEKLALAKLKVTQLKKQHQLERKMTELKFEKEMMEAQDIEILCGTTYAKVIRTRTARVKAKHCIYRNIPPEVQKCLTSRLSNKEYHSLMNSVKPERPLRPNHLNYRSERQRPLGPNHLNHRSERQRPLGPNHLNRRSNIFIVM